MFVKMQTTCRRTERPRGPLLHPDIVIWCGMCRIGGRLGSLDASRDGVVLEIPPLSYWVTNWFLLIQDQNSVWWAV